MKLPPLRSMLRTASLVLFAVLVMHAPARAQDEAAIEPLSVDTTATPVVDMPTESYEPLFEGEFRPGKGFDLWKGDKGSLNVSVYGLFRWVNQTPGTQTYEDHVGRERTVKARNDLNWHRTFVWLTGFFIDPRFKYNISMWSLPSTQQTLLFGNLRYEVDRALNFGVGIGPNLTARSLQGSWPYWAGSDRQMAEEFHRGGFSSAFFVTGEPIDKWYYTASVNTNISQLGVNVSDDSRDMAVSGSVWTMPTTGEFGPRGGFGDLEHHTKLATRFGASGCHSKESRYAPDDRAPSSFQIRLSDGVSPFEANAFGDSTLVRYLDYDEYAFDAAFKYKGFMFQSEFYHRRLSDFEGSGPAMPTGDIVDQGFMVQAGHMVVPRRLLLYATYGQVNDQFDRDPWEISGGASFYPFRNRAWRLNAHVIKVEKSPAASSFGYYSAGQTGTTFSIGTDILL